MAAGQASSGILSATVSYCIKPYLLWLSFIIFLASIGKSFGVIRAYIHVLLLIFKVSASSVSVDIHVVQVGDS